MPGRRGEVCREAAGAIDRAGRDGLGSVGALVGLDGFVDEIIEVVDKRYDAGRYDPVGTIAAMARKILGAAGESTNYELVVKRRKLGGNGPIMANALAAIGLGVTYVGNLGYPAIDPAFAPLADRARVISIAEPGHTDALEFADGKLMMVKGGTLADVNWPNLLERVGRDRLGDLFRTARLVGLMNWTMLPGMGEIWDRLLAEVLPGIPRGDRTLFVDLADPEKRTRDDLRAALATIGRFQEHLDVILGLNLKEAVQVVDVLGLPDRGDRESAIEDDARAIREALGIGCVVIHPRKAAAAATATESARFEGPFVQHPKISTGAGDHFNAGFCLGRIVGLGLEQSLCAGVACSGYYVRSAASPTAAELAAFLAELPDPEG